MHTRPWRRFVAGYLAGIVISFSLQTASLADDTANAQAAGTAAPPAVAQSLSAPLQTGDVAVSGFSGTTLASPSIPAGVDPLSETVIDPNGASLRIFDLTTLGGPTVAQAVDAPVKLAIPAAEIGQVFGLVFDDGAGPTGTGVPNLYAAATSAFGLQIVGSPGADGNPVRLKQGDPAAQFMNGQFGSLPGASPGSIWKIDGTTGAVTLLADTGFSGEQNTGPGIGDLAFDPQSRNLYASDLDTGVIHRFNVDSPGADLGQFDHGMSGRPGAGLPSLADDGKIANIKNPGFSPSDPSTWGFTQPARRVGALAVHDGRLYYSVADGPQIWSVALGPDGAFDTTARLELQLAAAQPFAVTDIAFDPQGNMILAQRGTLQSPADYGQFTAPGAQVLRYAPAPQGGTALWTAAPEEYPVGLPDGSRMGDGGIALTNSYTPDGTLGATCQATLLTTGDDLRDNPTLANVLPPGVANLHGIQINDASLTGGANSPPMQSAFIGFDPNQANPTATGHVGDVEAVPCGTTPQQSAASTAAPAQPAPATGAAAQPGPAPAPAPTNPAPPLTLTKLPAASSCSTDGGCEFSIIVTNPGPDPVPGPFEVQNISTAGGALQTQATLTGGPNPPWTCIGTAPVECTDPGPIAVGNTELRLSFTPSAVGGATDVLNCVQTDDPANPPLTLEAQSIVAPPPVVDAAAGAAGAPAAVGNAAPAAGAPAAGAAAAGAPATDPVADTAAADAEVTQQFPPQQCATIPLTPPANAGGATTPGTAPAGGGTTSPPVTVNGLTVSKSSTTATCTDTTDCEFTIHVSNTGTQPIPGPIAVNDTISGDGVFPPGATISTPPTAPWTCAPVQGLSSFNCSNPNALAPGASADFTIGLTLNSGQAIKDIKNCLLIKGANTLSCVDVPTPGNAAPAGGGKTSPPVTVNGLTVSKSAAATTCTDTTDCAFTVHVSNTGTQPIAGPIAVNDTMSGDGVFPPGTVISTPPAAPWTCTQVQGLSSFNCSNPNALAPGANADFTIGLKLNSGQAIKDIKNCLLIKGANTLSCVDVPTPGNTAPGGGGIVSPPQTVGGITWKKEGPATCTDTAECSFKIDVANTSNQTVNGPIQLKETLSSAQTPTGVALFPTGTVISTPASPPWTCTPTAGAPAAFDCANPNALAPGASADFTIGFKFNSGQAIKDINNCIFPAGADKPLCVDVPTPGNTVPGAPPANPAPAQTNTQPTPGEGIGTIPNGLSIIKRALSTTCSDTGGGCQFNVDLKNTGTAEFDGPINLTDVLTTGDGNPLSAASIEGSVAVTVASGTTVVPAVSCGPNSSGTFTCSTPATAPAKVPAGGLVIMQFTFKPGASNGATSIKNCVSMQGGPQNVCASIPLTNGPLLRAVKTTTSTTCTPECDFTVLVTNVGNADATGGFSFKDNFTPDNPNVQITKIAGDFNCTRLGPLAPLLCLDPSTAVLHPGETVQSSFRITGAQAAFQYQDCVEVSGAAETAVDETGNRCATITPPAPPALAPAPAPQLQIVKSAVTNPDATGQGTCTIFDPCPFTIVIKNTGTVPFVGTIEFTDKVSGVVQQIHLGNLDRNDTTWVCLDKTNTDTSGCISSQALTLAPGAQKPLVAQVVAGSVWAKNDILTNCVSVNFMNNATLDPTSQLCASVKLDPFNVKVQKTGDSSCAPDTDCHFALTLFNNGPIDHDAPVTLTDKLNIGTAPITSIEPPLPCAAQPTQVPFTCTSPGNFPLKIGDSHTYQITVHLPASATSFQNCAQVGPDIGNGSDASKELTELGIPSSCVSTTVQPPPGTGGISETSQPQTPPTQPPASTPTVQPGQSPGNGGINPIGSGAPTNNSATLALKKTGDASCTVGGTCNFTLVVTDQDASAFSGSMTIEDSINIGSAAIVSIQPPLPCGTQPTQIPFTCTTASDVRIGQAQAQTYRIAITVPPGLTAPSFTNCATVTGTSQALEELGTFNGPGPASCATVAVNPSTGGSNPSSQPQTPPTQSPATTAPQPQPAAPAACFSNMVPDGSGNCQCPAGTFWDGSKCNPGNGGTNGINPGNESPTPPKCPAGTQGTFPNCVVTSNGSGSNRTGGTNGTPQQVTPQCPVGTTGIFPNCVVARTSGNHAPHNPTPVQPRIVHVCPQGTVGTFPNCRPFIGTGGSNGSFQPSNTQPRFCPSGMIGTPPTCNCPPETHLSRSGRSCIPDRFQQPPQQQQQQQQQQQVCRGGMVGTFPNCQCPQGTRFSRSTLSCTAVEGRPQFPPRFPQPQPQQQQQPPVSTGPVCPAGERFDHRRRHCVPTVEQQPTTQPTQTQTPSSRTCPAGEHFVAGLRGCIPNPTTTPTNVGPSPNTNTVPASNACPPGFDGTKPNCVRDQPA